MHGTTNAKVHDPFYRRHFRRVERMLMKAQIQFTEQQIVQLD